MQLIMARRYFRKLVNNVNLKGLQTHFSELRD